KKTTHPNHLIIRFLTDFLNNKISFAGGWSHCVTPTTITSVFFSYRRQSQNRNPRRRRGTPRFSV
ncbi:TPA: hypothetical protein ACHKPI_005137, partial [Escherichia coli]